MILVERDNFVFRRDIAKMPEVTGLCHVAVCVLELLSIESNGIVRYIFVC